MPVRNVARGGGAAFRGEVKGLKELEAKLKALATDNPTLIGDLRKLVANATADVRDEMKRRAIGAGWANQSIKTRKGEVLMTGQQVIDVMFASTRETSDNPRQRINGLAGVSKRRSMVEWVAGRVGAFSWPTRSPRRVKQGGKVAEAFATMLEFGTTRMRARPAINPAIVAAKPKIISTLADGYNGLLAKYSK